MRLFKCGAVFMFLLMLLVSVPHSLRAAQLYEIFNHLFEGALTGNGQIYGSDFFVEDTEDDHWSPSGYSLSLDVAYRSAGYGHALGYQTKGVYTEIAGEGEIADGAYALLNRSFAPDSGFVWVDQYRNGDITGAWYSEDARNAAGQKDHFVALIVDDAAMLDYFGTHFAEAGAGNLEAVWLFGFEDQNLGDADYNDLVAAVSVSAAPSPIPVPGSLLLLLSPLAAVGGRRLLRIREKVKARHRVVGHRCWAGSV